MYDINQLKAMKLPELKEIAEKSKVPKFKSLNKQELVYKILDHQASNPESIVDVISEEQKPAAENKPEARKPLPKPKPKPRFTKAIIEIRMTIAIQTIIGTNTTIEPKNMNLMALLLAKVF